MGLGPNNLHRPHYVYPHAPPPDTRLSFEEKVDGIFWETNSNKRVVRLSYAEGSLPPALKMLIFWSHLNEDHDGNPRAYAPPTSAADWRPRGGMEATDKIGNATSVKWVPAIVPGMSFHPLDDADPIRRNAWLWAGIKSAKAAPPGRRIDDRGPWLQDAAGNYPLFTASGPYQEYYAPQTAITTRDGNPVNPEEVPYAALGASLKYNVQAQVRVGDFGLAIRPNGASTAFVYADAGGEDKETHVGSKNMGEVSTKLIRNLFAGPAVEAVCFIVFPGSRRVDSYVEPELMTSRVQERIRSLNAYDNADDLDPYLRGLLPVLSRWGFFRAPQSGNSAGLKGRSW